MSPVTVQSFCPSCEGGQAFAIGFIIITTVIPPCKVNYSEVLLAQPQLKGTVLRLLKNMV